MGADQNDPNWKRGVQTESWKFAEFDPKQTPSECGKLKPGETPFPGQQTPNYIFKINDVVLEIPPTNIAVHKEDMFWQWKTLRTKTSTKVPSGRGVCHVQLSIVFTPDLLLHLHRLITQFKHSPFCWIENQFLRESIIPHWPIWQQMAFTMTNFHVSSMKGNPGTFYVELDLRWFNYFPYTPNYLMRDEWKTWPIAEEKKKKVHDPEADMFSSTGTSRQATITTYTSLGRGLQKMNPFLPATCKATTAAGDYTPSETGNYSLVSQRKDIQTIWTIQDLVNTHAGASFDLQPLPQRMQPADPVADPSLSRIYVRYINMLQQKALYEDFGIDIAKRIIEATEYAGAGLKCWESMTYGEFGGRGIVQPIHGGRIPLPLRREFISGMLSYCERVIFYYDQYIAAQYNPKLQQQLKKQRLEWVKKKSIKKRANPVVSSDRAELLKAREMRANDEEKIFANYNASVRYGDPARQTTAPIEGTRETIRTSVYDAEHGNWDRPSALKEIPTTLECPFKTIPTSGEESTPATAPDGTPVLETSYTVQQECMHEDEYLVTGEWNKLPAGEAQEMLHLKWFPPIWDGKVDYGLEPGVSLPDGTTKGHMGIDIIEHQTSTEGYPVFAVEAGLVTKKKDPKYGRVLELKHYNLTASQGRATKGTHSPGTGSTGHPHATAQDIFDKYGPSAKAATERRQKMKVTSKRMPRWGDMTDEKYYMSSVEDAQLLVDVAKKIGTEDYDPGYLANAIHYESAGTFNTRVKNVVSSATGLIQFMSTTAKGMGTTTKKLAAMTFAEQLTWVEKYFKGKKLENQSDTYMKIFFPAALGKGPDYSIYDWYKARPKKAKFNNFKVPPKMAAHYKRYNPGWAARNKEQLERTPPHWKKGETYLTGLERATIFTKQNGGIKTAGDYAKKSSKSAKLPTGLDGNAKKGGGPYPTPKPPTDVPKKEQSILIFGDSQTGHMGRALEAILKKEGHKVRRHTMSGHSIDYSPKSGKVKGGILGTMKKKLGKKPFLKAEEYHRVYVFSGGNDSRSSKKDKAYDKAYKELFDMFGEGRVTWIGPPPATVAARGYSMAGKSSSADHYMKSTYADKREAYAEKCKDRAGSLGVAYLDVRIGAKKAPGAVKQVRKSGKFVMYPNIGDGIHTNEPTARYLAKWIAKQYAGPPTAPAPEDPSNPEYITKYYYLHSFANDLKESVPVKRGELLGYIGGHGEAMQWHGEQPFLHLEMEREGAPLDPWVELTSPMDEENIVFSCDEPKQEYPGQAFSATKNGDGWIQGSEIPVPLYFLPKDLMPGRSKKKGYEVETLGRQREQGRGGNTILQNLQWLALNLDVIQEKCWELYPASKGTPTIAVSSGLRKGGTKSSGDITIVTGSSQHAVGRAADIILTGQNTVDLARIVVDLIKDGKIMQGGIGIYGEGAADLNGVSTGKSTGYQFLHYDIRCNASGTTKCTKPYYNHWMRWCGKGNAPPEAQWLYATGGVAGTGYDSKKCLEWWKEVFKDPTHGRSGMGATVSGLAKAQIQGKTSPMVLWTEQQLQMWSDEQDATDMEKEPEAEDPIEEDKKDAATKPHTEANEPCPPPKKEDPEKEFTPPKPKDLEADTSSNRLAHVWGTLASDGWQYYEDDKTVTNVWKRTLALVVTLSNWNIDALGYSMNEDIAESLLYLDNMAKMGLLFQEGAVCTGISGNMQHIVASIPIIGHEFPTHQHLGSMEPKYEMTFTGLDRQAYQGLGWPNIALEGMRSTLMQNARAFRPVTDCWTMATDSFITRLFGSFHGNDLRAMHDGSDAVDLKKRSCITAMTTETIEGQPGAGNIRMNIAETNPFAVEYIEPPKLEKGPDLDKRRRIALQALMESAFAKKSQKEMSESLRKKKTVLNLIRIFGHKFTTQAEFEKLKIHGYKLSTGGVRLPGPSEMTNSDGGIGWKDPYFGSEGHARKRVKEILAAQAGEERRYVAFRADYIPQTGGVGNPETYAFPATGDFGKSHMGGDLKDAKGKSVGKSYAESAVQKLDTDQGQLRTIHQKARVGFINPEKKENDFYTDPEDIDYQSPKSEYAPSTVGVNMNDLRAMLAANGMMDRSHLVFEADQTLPRDLRAKTTKERMAQPTPTGLGGSIAKNLKKMGHKGVQHDIDIQEGSHSLSIRHLPTENNPNGTTLENPPGLIIIDVTDLMKQLGETYDGQANAATGELGYDSIDQQYYEGVQEILRFARFSLVETEFGGAEIDALKKYFFGDHDGTGIGIKEEHFTPGYYNRLLYWWFLYYRNAISNDNFVDLFSLIAWNDMTKKDVQEMFIGEDGTGGQFGSVNISEFDHADKAWLIHKFDEDFYRNTSYGWNPTWGGRAIGTAFYWAASAGGNWDWMAEAGDTGYRDACLEEADGITTWYLESCLQPGVRFSESFANKYLPEISGMFYPRQPNGDQGPVNLKTGSWGWSTGLWQQSDLMAIWFACPRSGPLGVEEYEEGGQKATKSTSWYSHKEGYGGTTPGKKFIPAQHKYIALDKKQLGQRNQLSSLMFKCDIKEQPKGAGVDPAVPYKMCFATDTRGKDILPDGVREWFKLKGKEPVPPLYAVAQSEKTKIEWVKRGLEKVADRLLADQAFLRKYKLEEVIAQEFLNSEMPAGPCYPDMDLPDHPYYPVGHNATEPDFYMWSIYEDAKHQQKAALQKAIHKQIEPFIGAPYVHQKKMQGQGIIKLDDLFNSQNRVVEGSGHAMQVFGDKYSNNLRLSRLVWHPDGADDLVNFKQKHAANGELYTEGADGNTPEEREEKRVALLAKGMVPHVVSKNGGNPYESMGPMQNPFRYQDDFSVKKNATGNAETVSWSTYKWNYQKGGDNYSKFDSNKTGKAGSDWVQETQTKQQEIYGSDKATFVALKKQIDEIAKGMKHGDSAAVAKIEGLNAQILKLEAATRKDYMSVKALSVTDGNPQNASSQRIDANQYKDLMSKGRNVESMFGSIAGYTGELLPSDGPIATDIADTALAAVDTMAHAFNPDALKRLCIDSSHDITSQKQTMRRAFPTFKLFFVEEDQWESKWLNFDDFYSFNGVQEFTFHQTRKAPGDVATIIMQNVAGTLDGTKRGVKADLDYFSSGAAEEDIEAEARHNAPDYESIGKDDNSNRRGDSVPFGSVVLRPGMNVQLRVGYSNDPQQLEVLLSGRVTDIAWNKPGDRVEIVVQSFGTELAQIIHGRANVQNATKDSSLSNEMYPMTHHLLGSCMLSPELKHFGRWAKGQLLMVGEMKSHTLDFYDYGSDAPFGLDATTGVFKWLMNHRDAAAIAGVALTIVMLFPPARVIGQGGKLAVSAAGKEIIEQSVKQGIQKASKEGVRQAARSATRRFSVRQAFKGGASRIREAGGRTLASMKDDLGKYSTARVASTVAGIASGAGRGAAGAVKNKLKSAAWWTIGGRGAQATSHVGMEAAEQAIRANLANTVRTKALDKALFDLVELGVGEGGKRIWIGTAKMGAGSGQGFKFGVKKFFGLQSGGMGFAGEAGMASSRLLQHGFTKGNPNLIIDGIRVAQANARFQTFGYLGGLSSGAGGVLTEGGFAIMGGGAGGQIAKAIGGQFIRAPGVAVRGSIAIAPVLVAADIFKAALFDPIYDATIGDLRKRYTKAKAFYKLYPQDDNLFPPNPTSYVKLDYSWLEDTSRAVGGVLGYAWSTIMHIPFITDGADSNAGFDDTSSKVTGFLNAITNPYPAIWDKRMNKSEAAYYLRGSTIWDVFHEMSLRHPGWIYGARPYGTRFEYRMFFGVPSQRYWSKPYENALVARLNDIRRHFNKDLSKSTLKLDGYEVLYGKVARDEMEDAKEQFLADKDDEINQWVRDNSPLASSAIDDGKKAMEEEAEREAEIFVKLKMSTRALDEYLKGLENRFVPFRRYHVLDSNHDIVANNIISSEHNVINAVNVNYFNSFTGGDDPIAPTNSVVIKAHSSIDEDKLRMETIAYPNCHGYATALRYGMGHLIHTMKEMYRGEIIVLGNNRIRPWDIAILHDTYNDMAGPVEVEAVTHMFSHETGYLTEIKPNAMVIGNEMSSWPVLEGLKIFQMAIRDNASGKSQVSPKTLSESSLMDPFVQMFSSTESKEAWRRHLEQRYGEIFEEGFDLSQIFPQQAATWDSQHGDDEVPRAGVGMRGPAMSDPSGLGPRPSQLLGALGGTVAGMTSYMAFKRIGFGLQGVSNPTHAQLGAKGVQNLVTGTGFNSKFLRAGWKGVLGAAAGVAAVTIGAGVYDAIRIEDGTESTCLQWLIGGSILMKKCLEEEVIMVIPLNKGGKPLVSGLQTTDPLTLWRNVMGKITNVFADTVEGSTDLVEEYMSFGDFLWNHADDYWKLHDKKLPLIAGLDKDSDDDGW